MTSIESQLIERLKKLPPSRVAEVVDFVEFLAAREERGAAAQRLTEGLARLDALNLPPISQDEVEDEVQAARLTQAGLTPEGIVGELRRLGVVVSTPAKPPRVVTTDPDDDHVIAAAIAGTADLIASGDKRDLLPLGSYQGIEIVTARVAIERIGSIT